MKYYCIQIKGKVQGVAFRYYSKMKADELGLKGSTKNQIDGSVVSHVMGEKEDIDQFIKWCHIGSPASDVKEVIISPISIQENQEYTQFTILR